MNKYEYTFRPTQPPNLRETRSTNKLRLMQ